MKRLVLEFPALFNGMRDFSLIKKSPTSLANPGFALRKPSPSLNNLKTPTKKKPKRRKRSPKASPRKRRRKKNPRKRKSLKRKNRRRKRRVRSSKRPLRRREILWMNFPSLTSTSMTGKESSSTHQTEPLLCKSFGESWTLRAGLSGRFNTLNTRVKELSDI